MYVVRFNTPTIGVDVSKIEDVREFIRELSNRKIKITVNMYSGLMEEVSIRKVKIKNKILQLKEFLERYDEDVDEVELLGTSEDYGDITIFTITKT